MAPPEQLELVYPSSQRAPSAAQKLWEAKRRLLKGSPRMRIYFFQLGALFQPFQLAESGATPVEVKSQCFPGLAASCGPVDPASNRPHHGGSRVFNQAPCSSCRGRANCLLARTTATGPFRASAPGRAYSTSGGWAGAWVLGVGGGVGVGVGGGGGGGRDRLAGLKWLGLLDYKCDFGGEGCSRPQACRGLEPQVARNRSDEALARLRPRPGHTPSTSSLFTPSPSTPSLSTHSPLKPRGRQPQPL